MIVLLIQVYVMIDLDSSHSVRTLINKLIYDENSIQ